MYNPFKKNIYELEYEDLKKLIDNNVSEGWFVEYKGSFNTNKKIAKSIASFANSKGGWYIVGINELNDESGPGKIIGFDLEENKKPTDKITNIIKDNIDPTPQFISKIVKIPGNKVVLVVQIFEGNNPPYICDGRIYVRVNEITDNLNKNKFEEIRDRYSFERLLEKKQRFDEEINYFMSNHFSFDKSFKNPYLEFYIYVNNPNGFLFENFYSEEFFEEVKENFNSEVELFDNFVRSFISFDNINASVDSYILRHIPDNPLFPGLVIELFAKGHLKLILPFNVYNKNSFNKKYNTINQYKSFIPNSDNLRIIDLAEVMVIFQIIMEQYKRLLKKYDCDYDVFIKYNFKNFKLITTFFDNEELIEFIKENKLPINLKESIEIPSRGYKKYRFDDLEPFHFISNMVAATGFPRHLGNIIAQGFLNFIKSTFDKK